MKCKSCQTNHYLSYSLAKDSQIKEFYPITDKTELFQMTSDSVFEIKLFNSVLADILFKISSFDAACQSYNDQFDWNTNMRPLNQKRLEEAFFLFQCVKYFQEFISNDPRGLTGGIK